MRVTALQTDIKWAQRKANQEVAESMIASCPQSDLYVLPEMWATGFTMKPQEHAEDLLQAGNSLEWMQQMSLLTGTKTFIIKQEANVSLLHGKACIFYWLLATIYAFLYGSETSGTTMMPLL